jgi:hypothetical protein
LILRLAINHGHAFFLRVTASEIVAIYCQGAASCKSRSAAASVTEAQSAQFFFQESRPVCRRFAFKDSAE